MERSMEKTGKDLWQICILSITQSPLSPTVSLLLHTSPEQRRGCSGYYEEINSCIPFENIGKHGVKHSKSFTILKDKFLNKLY